MENISQIVNESLARHGVAPGFDYLRLQWSRWCRCDSSFSVLLVPAKPGIFALAEEIIPPAGPDPRWVEQGLQPCINDAQTNAALAAEVPLRAKRMLAVFHIAETADLGMTLGRLFLPGNLLREKLETGKCFARFTVIEDSAERSAAHEIFQRWLRDSAEASFQDVA